jgi:ubiquinone/menaquinone biosynthesis C-methylase UbiE
MNNYDSQVVQNFGEEWKKFDQSDMTDFELESIFKEYFQIFPWLMLPEKSQGFDLGCGSGRWAKIVSTKCFHLHCIDPSEAIEVAKKNLKNNLNCSFYKKGVDEIPLDNSSMDFGYSLGVLHHIPDTQAGIIECVKKLKPGAPFLLYLYYAFDNQPFWYRFLWKLSNFFRLQISKLPFNLKLFFSQCIAFLIYYPLAKISKFLDILKFNIHSFPLSAYRNKSFYTMKTDALDRFGTKLESRYTKEEIKKLMSNAGLENIIFSDKIPFWVALGYKKI